MGAWDTVKSGVSKVGEGLSENLLGNIEKAQIRIIDKNSLQEMRERGLQEIRDGVNYKKSKSQETLAGNQTNIPMKRKNKIPNPLDPNSLVGDGVSDDSVKATVFTVQFNPSELSLEGRAGGNAPISDFSSKDDNELSMGEVSLHITLHVRLVFDRVVPGDAFTGVTSTSASAALQRGASLLSSGSDERERKKKSKLIVDAHSVRGEVEAFIGAVRNENTRIINFKWGEFIDYTGVVNNVSATYAMFNTNGEPIRAFVDLSILVADEKNDDLSDLVEGVWYQKYVNAFGKTSSYVKAGQNIGSIIGWG